MAACADSGIYLWNSNIGKSMNTLYGHSDSVNKALFTIDGKNVVSISADCTLRTWSVLSGKEN